MSLQELKECFEETIQKVDKGLILFDGYSKGWVEGRQSAIHKIDELLSRNNEDTIVE